MVDRRRNMEFGILAALVLLVVGEVRDIHFPAVAIVVLLVALLLPKLFTPFTWLWFRLGDVLGAVATRVLLLLIFSVVVTPVGLLRRMLGEDVLRLRGFGKGRDSVFTVCDKRYEAADMEKQY